MSQFTIPMFEFSENENFDMFNDLTLNPNDDIMPNCLTSYMMPSTDQSPTPPSVYELTDCEYGCDSGKQFEIPIFTILLTDLGNVWQIKCTPASSGSSYDSYIKNYYSERYQYYNGYHEEKTYHQNDSISIETSLLSWSLSKESHANTGYYLTYDGFNYNQLVPPFYIDTNIPIILVDRDFDTNSNAMKEYQRHTRTLDDLIAGDEHILGLLNGKEPEIPPLVTYELRCTAYQYTVNEYGEKTQTDANPIYRGFRIRSRNKVNLYKKAGIIDGALQYGISFDNPEICYYSSGDASFETWQTMTGGTTLPFNFMYRPYEDELGTFYCCENPYDVYNNLLIFKDEEDSNKYKNDEIDETEAENYDEFSGKIKPKNPTGEDDETTEFGQVYTQAFFSQQYIVTTAQMYEIANALYDTTAGGLFEDIKKGLQMYGDSVVDDIQSVIFYPFAVDSVITNYTSQPYIYFGGYKFDMQSNVKKIVYPNGYYDFGTIHIYPSFSNYRDYEPYTKLYCYLPYISWVQLDIKKYLNKDVNVRYYFDTRTGTCCAVLTANGVMCDYYNGQCGVSMPITLTDFSRYAQTQIQTLLGFNQPTNTGMAGDFAKNMGAGLVESGALSVGAFAGASLGVGAMIQTGKTVYGLSQNNINNFSKTVGASSSMINQFLPQEVCFMFEIQDADITPYHTQLHGLPSNKSGVISDFSGFLQVDTVNLKCSGATANEQAEIVRMLQNGIII